MNAIRAWEDRLRAPPEESTDGAFDDKTSCLDRYSLNRDFKRILRARQDLDGLPWTYGREVSVALSALIGLVIVARYGAAWPVVADDADIDSLRRDVLDALQTFVEAAQDAFERPPEDSIDALEAWRQLRYVPPATLHSGVENLIHRMVAPSFVRLGRADPTTWVRWEDKPPDLDDEAPRRALEALDPELKRVNRFALRALGMLRGAGTERSPHLERAALVQALAFAWRSAFIDAAAGEGEVPSQMLRAARHQATHDQIPSPDHQAWRGLLNEVERLSHGPEEQP